MGKSENFVLGVSDDRTNKHKSSLLRPKFSLRNATDRNDTQNEEKEKNVSFLSLFRYSSASDRVLVCLGIISSFLGALGLPLVIIIYGDFVTLLVDRKMNNQTLSPVPLISWLGGGRTSALGDEEDLADAIREDGVAWVLGCTLSGAIQCVFSFMSILLLNFTSLKQSAKLRRLFLKAVLRQDMSWFDVNNANTFASKVSEDLNHIQEGMGDKIGLFLFLVLTFLTSMVMAFCQGWKLTLVVCVCSPLIIASIAYVGKIQTRLTADELKAYGKAGSVAQEVLSSIKTVMAFGGEDKEIERYKTELESSKQSGIRRGCYTGLGAGASYFIIYSCYSLAFWYGTTLVLKSREENNFEYTPSVIIMVFYGVLAGATNLGHATPHLEAFSAAKGAARSIFSVIERVPGIDALSTSGKTLPNVRGDITMQNVSFRYPARPETEVLKGVNMKIKKGEVIAVVGSSGSGKSTLLQLLQRLYDPSNGSISLDGEDIKDLNVGWFRRQIAVVGQEPSLFATSIYENIRYGMEGATANEVEYAAKLANAHDFIMKLPKQYDTVLGEGGTQLSGGQKQRIAIARAIIRNPKILLLDEATSALDAVSERAVQAALDRASKGRTTVIVTHKLSNITNVDRIIVMSDGRIMEQGTHEELISLGGLYFTLAEIQATTQAFSVPAIPTGGGFREDVGEPRLSTVLEEDFSEAILRENGEAVKEKQDDTGDDDYRSVSTWRILKYNKPEWLHFIVGSISTLLVGGSLPLVSVTLGEIYGVLSDPDPTLVMNVISMFCILFLAVAVVSGMAMFLQNYTFNYAGVLLTNRLRIDAFSSILKQEAGWFDDEKHDSGILCTRLSGDAAAVHGATGSSVAVLLQSFSTLFIGVIISFLYSWKMALVTMTTVPIVFVGVYLESKVVHGQNLLENNALEKSARGAMEAIINIRTVASLGREQAVLDKFDQELLGAEKTMYVKSIMRALAFTLGQTSPFVSYGLSLWYGSRLVAEGELPYKNIFKVTEALLFGAWTLAHALASAPNFSKAKMSAARIFGILDRKVASANDATGPNRDWKADGRVSFSKVRFSYPTRPETEVLRGLDLDIRKGLSVALVGQSGCGKSTIIQLLQKLYNPSHGRICLDDHNIADIEVELLRKQFGIVSQEPVLFDRTIEENIAYGDNSRIIPREEVIAAAKSANIHDFITCLPLGYETRLGSGGGQLSGGQKQRIAIARALIRNPRILLLDEATSALDAANESVVQAALDKAAAGRTTITVGHKMGAFHRADVICVMDKGRVVEYGTHEELLLANGKYAEMLNHSYSHQ